MNEHVSVGLLGTYYSDIVEATRALGVFHPWILNALVQLGSSRVPHATVLALMDLVDDDLVFEIAIERAFAVFAGSR